jgi:hypothetical protein
MPKRELKLKIVCDIGSRNRGWVGGLNAVLASKRPSQNKQKQFSPAENNYGKRERRRWKREWEKRERE